MNLLTVLLQAEGQPQGSALGAMAPMFLIIIIFVVFMIFMGRSRRRQEEEHRQMVLKLEPGSRVMLNSGLIARVARIDKENQEARLVVDEEKRVHAVYNVMSIAKVFEEKTASVKEKDSEPKESLKKDYK